MIAREGLREAFYGGAAGAIDRRGRPFAEGCSGTWPMRGVSRPSRAPISSGIDLPLIHLTICPGCAAVLLSVANEKNEGTANRNRNVKSK